MLFTLQDVTGLLLAMVLAVPVLVLPGALVAHAVDLLGFRAIERSRRAMVASLAGLATVPLIASLVARVLGLDLAVVVLALLAIGGGMVSGRALLPDWSRSTWRAVAGAICLLALVVVDLAGGGRLYPSLLMIDLVKHAAFTRAIVETGAAPPIDPFFLRPGAASYYYFFYTPAAVIERLGSGLISSRMAFAGLIPWVALATVGLADLVYEKAGFSRRAGERRVPLILILMSTAGLQLVLLVMFWMKGETWREQSGWLNEMVSSFLVSVLWVPHHLSAFLTAWVGFLLLVEATGDGRTALRRKAWTPIAFAGVAFACTVGMSVWVAIGAVAIVGLWLVVSIYERRWVRVAAIAAAGLVAAILIAPHLMDLRANRDFAEFPIEFRVRFFVLADGISDALGGGRAVLRLLLLPVNYFWEAAVLVMGALFFWQRHSRADIHRNEVARLLTLSTIASLLIGSFFAAAIANNDLGWRVLLFAQFGATLWTTSVLWPLWQRMRGGLPHVIRLRFVPRSMTMVATLGLIASTHDVAMLRAHVLVNQSHPTVRPHDAAVMFDERVAYGWLQANAQPRAVIQHNPNTARAFGFGLYGRHRTAVSDLHQAALFGASPVDVARRINDIMPIFKADRLTGDVKRDLAAAGVDVIMITRRDPAWRARADWVFASPALLVRDSLRVVATGDLADGPRVAR